MRRTERSFFGVAFFAVALMITAPVVADSSRGDSEISDALAPKTRPEDALVRQLHTATYVTDDLEEYRRFYVDGLGLTLDGPREIDDDTRVLQRRLWGIPEEIGWDVYRLYRDAVDGTIQIRLLVLDRATPVVHTTWDAREPGPFSTGYPSRDVPAWDRSLREMGYDAMNPMSSYSVPRPDGTTYGIDETIFKAPDFMHAVTISRKDGMPQLGPIDPSSGNGGPVYSAQSIRDSDAVLAFYTEVLGMELRSDREWKSHGSKGALAVPDGTVFRFSIVYAHGARDGHLLFIDFRDGALPDSGVAPRPPHQGMVMWSFPSPDLDAVLERAALHGVRRVGGPFLYRSPTLGTHRTATLEAPNGFLVEVFEPLLEDDGLDGREIVERATEAAGGENWRRPRTLRMRGSAMFYGPPTGDGPEVADRYEMWRVFPTESEDAHRANGMVRIDAFDTGRVIFQTAFDGETTYNQDGPVPTEQAQQDWSSAFGFGIIRFALDEGFVIDRLPDERVDGHACYRVNVVDPTGSETQFGIDRRDYSIRWVGFQTPRGWHERIYSDFYRVEPLGFRQPGRVRLYYDGAKTTDISWWGAWVNEDLGREIFRIE